jgi:hypothetical protein
VQLTEAAGGEAHVDAGQILGERELALRDLVRPATLFDALAGEIERVPDGAEVAVVGRRRGVDVGVLTEQGPVLGAGVARGVILLRLGGVFGLLCLRRERSQCRRRYCGRSHAQELPSGYDFR